MSDHPLSRTVPAVLVTGVCPEAMAATTIGLQWDLPKAVAVQHEIDVETQQLHRIVSDVTGVLERESIDLAHACVSCAIREDIVPTLMRLADLDRWETIVAHLPVGATALQVCRVLALEDQPPVHVSAVVAALDGPSIIDTLTGDALLCEIGRHSADDDRRGLAETAGAIVEYADVVCVHGEAPVEGLALARALAQPQTLHVGDGDALPPGRLLVGLHDHTRTEAWVAETRREPLPRHGGGAVWQLDLRSDRPFHPDRLHDQLEILGSGPHRSRGCFWLASRPGEVCGWDGGGGQVSIGPVGVWGRKAPMVRLVVTGLESLTSQAERADLRKAFDAALLTDVELRTRGPLWEVHSDGFEPWLGDIRAVA